MQGTDSYRVIVRRGPQPNQSYPLDKDIITVGRDITNDIVINDPEVSRHHLRFTRGAAGFTIEDLGSTNGTFLNGQRLSVVRPLNNGDMIGLGETVTLGYEVVHPSVEAGYFASNDPVATVQSQVPQQPVASQPAYSAPAQQQPQPAASEPQRGVQPVYSQQQPPQAPATGGYYEEYEEEAPNNTLRIVLIGCALLIVFCCCATIAAIFIIDSQCLWDSIPVVSDVLQAFGYEIDPSLPQCR